MEIFRKEVAVGQAYLNDDGTLKTNALYYGDNLEILKSMPDESVDLVYCDPPFNSGRDYYMSPAPAQKERKSPKYFTVLEMPWKKSERAKKPKHLKGSIETVAGGKRMDNARKLLTTLTEQMPPGPNQRHNMTVDEAGNLVICLMLGKEYHAVTFEDYDLEKPVEELVSEIVSPTPPPNKAINPTPEPGPLEQSSKSK